MYLFKDQASAETYQEMHTTRLRDMGVDGEITAVSYTVNEALSEVTHAKLAR
ncbi:YdhR family protein [Corynebacterium casei]|uniref:YdhR family protein n=1 Tax=Corynebacterium casei TaxID=160386 RepID=UPI003F93338F